MVRPDFAFSRCPVDNDCLVTNGRFSPCGEANAHLPPFPPAEELCTRALAGRIRIEKSYLTADFGPIREAETNTNIAWLHAESGIVTPDQVASSSHFDKAVDYANTAMHNPYTFIHTILSAAILHLYRPIFMARKEGVAPTRQEIASLYQGLGVIFDALLVAPSHGAGQAHIQAAFEGDLPHRPCVETEGHRLSMLAKIFVKMLAARKNVFVNPASTRESQGTEEFVAQNHSGYILKNHQKVPVRISAKEKSVASQRSGGVTYDERVIFINCTGLVNKALDTLRQRWPQYYESVLSRHLQQKPGLIDAGRLLRSEQSGVRLDPASMAWIEAITADLMGQLGIDPKDYAQAETTAKDLPWSILPTAIVNYQKYPPEHEDPKLLKAASRAREEYLRFGGALPSRDELRRLIGQMRQVSAPHLLHCCTGAYLDLARNPETNAAEAAALVDAAAALSSTFAAKDWREIPSEDVNLLFKTQLLRAYTSMYKKTLAGKKPDINDLSRLYLDLIQAGRNTIEPSRTIENVRAVQFEIGIHLLAVRASLRRNRVVQQIWPSTPREDTPHDFSFEFRNGWDAAISTGAFLDQGTECHLLKVISLGNQKQYNPAATVIRGREDLTTSTSASIIVAVLRELEASSLDAKSELNRYERALMQKTIGLVD